MLASLLILLLAGIVFAIGWACLGLMDSCRRLEDALDYLHDEECITSDQLEKVMQIINGEFDDLADQGWDSLL